MLQNVTIVARTVVLAGLVGLVGWWTLFIRNQLLGHQEELQRRDEQIEALATDVAERDERIAELDVQLEESRQRIRELEVAMWLLKVNHRLARVEVIDQGPDPDRPDETVTRIRFVELSAEGDPAGEPREIEVRGKVLYVEGLVVKFEDDFVEGGDLLRGSSVALFKRVFSENQAPSEGVAIDRPRMHPIPHLSQEGPDPFYEELWERFWDYANDPSLAAEKGVRAMHGEAPSIELRPGKSYRVELRASGGLTIRPED